MIDLVRPQNALLTNQVASALTTNLVGASLAAPGGFLKAGQVWEGWLFFTYLHTAAVTPTLTCELAVAGVAVLALVVTPVATAATYHGSARVVFTVRSVGVGGTIMGALQVFAHGLTAANAGAAPAQVDTTADTIDTTIARLIELRIRMTTAVASNTLTVSQGFFNKLVG